MKYKTVRLYDQPIGTVFKFQNNDDLMIVCYTYDNGHEIMAVTGESAGYLVSDFDWYDDVIIWDMKCEEIRSE